MLYAEPVPLPLAYLPTSDTLSIEPINAATAAQMVVEHHYLHRRPPISYAFGLYQGGLLVGCVTFGIPASRHLQKGVCPLAPDLVLELNRLWVSDEMPKNTESWFVSRSLKLLPPRIVVSYADTTHGHYGFIYRALNFYYAGWTDMERKTPRFDYVPIKLGAHSRDAFRTGWKERKPRKPKIKYWTVTGDKHSQQALLTICEWPMLDWQKQRPPGERRKRKPKAA